MCFLAQNMLRTPGSCHYRRALTPVLYQLTRTRQSLDPNSVSVHRSAINPGCRPGQCRVRQTVQLWSGRPGPGVTELQSDRHVGQCVISHLTEISTVIIGQMGPCIMNAYPRFLLLRSVLQRKHRHWAQKMWRLLI